MRPINDFSPLMPDDRRSELARILAGGMLRLHARAALPDEVKGLCAKEYLPDSAPERLEVPGQTVLTVHSG